MFIPVWAILVSLLVSGAFVPRYARVAAVGFFIVVPIVASRLRNQLAPLLLCLLSCAIFVRAFRATAEEVPYQRPLEYRRSSGQRSLNQRLWRRDRCAYTPDAVLTRRQRVEIGSRNVTNPSAALRPPIRHPNRLRGEKYLVLRNFIA